VADTYAVTSSDIAAELPGLYPSGFSATSTPTTAQVQSLIDAADAIVTFQLRGLTGVDPSLTDQAASMVERYIIETVKAQVIRIAYVGRDPAYVASMAGPYDVLAKGYLTTLVGVPIPLIVPQWGASSVIRGS
jgi:hypothetical protein